MREQAGSEKDCEGEARRTTAASSKGKGSGASASSLYTFKKELSAILDRLVRASISP